MTHVIGAGLLALSGVFLGEIHAGWPTLGSHYGEMGPPVWLCFLGVCIMFVAIPVGLIMLL